MRRTTLREDVARQLAAVDGHSPSILRVNGVMGNMDAWYAAFAIPESARLSLAPEKSIRIW